jgi:hypothetical protein
VILGLDMARYFGSPRPALADASHDCHSGVSGRGGSAFARELAVEPFGNPIDAPALMLDVARR